MILINEFVIKGNPATATAQQKQYKSKIKKKDSLILKQGNIPQRQKATQNMEDMSGSAGI